jgi:hypothetical protein
LIRTRLAEAFPDDGLLGEESGGVERYWVADPIDGTTRCTCSGSAARTPLQVAHPLPRFLRHLIDHPHLPRAGGAHSCGRQPLRIMPIRQFYECLIRNKASGTAGTAKVGTKSKIDIKHSRSYFVKILPNLTKIKLLKNSSESANKFPN